MTVEEQGDLLDKKAAYLLYEGVMCNEGQNGIILEVESPDETIILSLEPLEDSVTKTTGSVAKVLKVYNRESFGSGLREYGSQKKAKDVLDAHRGDFDNELAEVPNPFLYRDISLTDDLAEKLKLLGAHVTDRAEVLFMDAVPGKDIATILYRELLKRHPSARYLQMQDVDSWKITELSQEVSRLFFSRLGNTNGNTKDRAQANERVFRANAETLIEELSNVGFHVDPRVIAIIKNTLKCLRQNGIAMLDAHERNFMIDGDIENLSAMEKVYIIDFGDTECKGRPITDDDFDGCRLDTAVPLFLEKLNSLRREKKAKIDKLEWFQRDPKTAAIFSRVQGKKDAFMKNKESTFGLSKSSKENRVKLFEAAIDAAFEEYVRSGEFDMKAVLRVLSSHGIKPKQEDTEKNTIWNANAFLEGFLYKIMKAVKDGTLREADIQKMVNALAEVKIFEKVFSYKRHWNYWDKEYFTHSVPGMIVDMAFSERKAPTR